MILIDSLIVIGLATANVGTIQETAGPQHATFRLVNAGEGAVRLAQSYTSCHCTTLAMPADSIVMPGDTTSVTLSFNPKGRGGDFMESGTIIYNAVSDEKPATAPRRSLRLEMTGSCISAEETIIRQFPVRISDDIRLTTSQFDLGIMTRGMTRTVNLVALHRSQNDRREIIPITFTPENNLQPGLHSIPYTVTIDSVVTTITLRFRLK